MTNSGESVARRWLALKGGLGSGHVAGLAAAVTFGASAPFTAAFAGGGSPLFIAGLLYGGAAIVLVPIAIVRLVRRRATLPARRDLGTLAVITVLGGMVAPVLLVVGLERLSSSVASLLLNFEAVATVTIGVVAFREHLGRRGWVALGLVVAGGGLLVGAPAGSFDLPGAAAIAGACACWGIDNNLSRRLALHDVFVISGAKALGAATPMLVLALATDRMDGSPVIAGLLLVGIIGFGCSIGLDLFALRQLGATREAVLFATAPFVGAAVGLALGEPLGWAGLGAGVLMAAGVALLVREDHDHTHHHEVMTHGHWHSHDDDHHDHDHPPDLEIVEGRRGRHLHVHDHQDLVHAHPHAPDAHHRHRHGAAD